MDRATTTLRRDGGWLTLVLVALCLLFLGRALVGEVFLSTEVVYSKTQPWLEQDAELHNPFLADHSTIYYPWLLHTRRELREGRFPLWSGESYGGVPFFGNLSVALLSPFTWLFVLLPFESAFAVVAAFKWLLAGWGTLLLARRLGLAGWPAVLASVAYAFAGFQVVWINSALTHVSVLAPWCLWALERCIARPSSRSTAVLALFWFLQFVGGHPETTLYLVFGCLVFGALRLSTLHEGRARALVAVGGAGILALALGAAQLLPFLEYVSESEGLRLRGTELGRPALSPLSPGGALAAVLGIGLLWVAARTLGRKSRRSIAGMAALAVGSAVMLRAVGLRPILLLQLVPDYYGNPLDGGSYSGPLTYTDLCAGFCGGVTALLAVVALFARKERVVRFLGLAGLLILARVYRVPWLSQLLDALLETTGSTRSLAMGSLFWALLGGWGLQCWAENSTRAWRALLFGLAFGIGLAVPAESWVPRSGEAERVLSELPESVNFAREYQGEQLWMPIEGEVPAGTFRCRLHINEVELGPVHLWPPELGSDRLRFEFRWVGVKRQEEGRYRVVVEALDQSGGVLETQGGTVELVRPPRWSWRWLWLAVAVGIAAAGCMGTGRSWGAPLVVLAVVVELVCFGARYNDTTPSDRLPAPLEPIPFLQNRWSEEGPFRVLGAGTILQPNLHYPFGLQVLRGYDALEPRRTSTLLRFMNPGHDDVPWVLQDFSTLDLESPIADLMNLRFVISESDQPDPGFHQVWSDGVLNVYENEDVLPRVFTVSHAVHYEIGDPTPAASLWRDNAVWSEAAMSFPSPGQVSDLKYASGRIQARVNSAEGTIAIVSENFAEGWNALVNGRPAEIHATHLALMAVVVPPGEHQVEWVYRPTSVRIGTRISLAALAVTLVLLGLRARRRVSEPEGTHDP